MKKHPKSDKIQRLIKQAFSATQQKLSLINTPKHWKKVIMYRNWEQIKTLKLQECHLMDSDILIIVNLKWPNLEKLCLGWNFIKNVAKVWQNQWQQLSQLQLWNNNIIAEGLTKLPTATLTELRYLNLGSRGVKLLIKADLPLLEALYLVSCQLNNSGIKHTAKAKWSMLKQCYLSQNRLKYDGLFALPCFNIPKLQILRVSQSIIYYEVVYSMMINSPQIAMVEWADAYNGTSRSINAMLRQRFVNAEKQE